MSIITKEGKEGKNSMLKNFIIYLKKLYIVLNVLFPTKDQELHLTKIMFVVHVDLLRKKIILLIGMRERKNLLTY